MVELNIQYVDVTGGQYNGDQNYHGFQLSNDHVASFNSRRWPTRYSRGWLENAGLMTLMLGLHLASFRRCVQRDPGRPCAACGVV